MLDFRKVNDAQIRLENGIRLNGETTIKEINLEPIVKRRLQMLGLTKGTNVEVLNNKKSGSLIFKVRGTRFAIGKQIAEGIIVGGGN